MAATSHGIQVVERERIAPPAPSAPSQPADPTVPVAVGEGDGAVPVAGIGVLGLLTLLIGAWGGIVPFIGPIIGANADGTMSWYWSAAHAWLWLVPGAVACVASAIMVGTMPRAKVGLGRRGAIGAGALAVLCGAWFVIGPEAWPVLVRSAGVFVPAPPLTSLTREIGYSYGPGVLLVLFGATAMGMGMAGRRNRGVAAADPAPARATTPPATQAGTRTA